MTYGKTAAALAALTLALAAPARAELTDGFVHVGVLTDMSGSNADVGGTGSVLAAEMAIEDFGGSVLGVPIKLISADHQQKPDVGISIARRWFDVEGVDIILDMPVSAIALAVQALAEEKNRISIASTAATEALTDAQCSPNGAHWTYNSYAVGKALSGALATPDSSWFFLTVDIAGGHALENSLKPFLEAAGAKMLGSVYHPQSTADMSSYLLQAQASGAQYIALSNAGADLINMMKQAHEFGLQGSGQTLVGTALFLTDLKAVGLEIANGLTFATAFVPQSSPEATEWAQRFFERHKTMPTDTQAGVYSAVLHYLRAVEAAGTDEAQAVMRMMKDTPVNDMFATNGVLREDGRMVHDIYLVRAKLPSESTGEWDLIELVKTIPGEEAFRPLSESGCDYITAAQ
ncbi:ABC transporter substrate-binding protein [Pseudogemmobacter sonorensis]|uniref:ABC transporter substrate-binding protein n=1 Tax=Pseudogemmobacter sonorensis TaxID=2989681 RepID=UPI0036CC621D